MSTPAVLAVIAAGLVAGAINVVVGSGSLLTFPTLLAVGYAPIVANVSNTVGLVFGSASGAVGYRGELAGQGPRIAGLGIFGLAGGIGGAVLLLALPARLFQAIVPALVALALVLVVLQPRLSGVIGRGQWRTGRALTLRLSVLATGIYGGYFGAAQSIILFALLALFIDDDLQHLNGLKNVLAALINGVAAVIFVFRAPVAWEPALLIAGSSLIGGQIGAHVGRRLSRSLLRSVIVVGGTVALLKLVL